MTENNYDDLLAKAICFAAQQHSGQVRKGSNIPYIVHALEAAAIVAAMTEDRQVIAAAVLHDTLEDCEGVSPDLLHDLFGEKISSLVMEESEIKQQDAAGSWKDRKRMTLDGLNDPFYSKEHKILTLGDKLSNLRAMYRDELMFGDSLWERFNQKDKSEHKWYYTGIANALTVLDEYPAMQEYVQLLGKVFPDQ